MTYSWKDAPSSFPGCLLETLRTFGAVLDVLTICSIPGNRPSSNWSKNLFTIHSLFLGEPSCHKPCLVLLDVAMYYMNYYINSLQNYPFLQKISTHGAIEEKNITNQKKEIKEANLKKNTIVIIKGKI